MSTWKLEIGIERTWWIIVTVPETWWEFSLWHQRWICKTQRRKLIHWLYFIHLLCGTHQAKKGLPACAKCADSKHPAHAQNLIREFALYCNILQCPIILSADSEGLDQIARMNVKRVVKVKPNNCRRTPILWNAFVIRAVQIQKKKK